MAQDALVNPLELRRLRVIEIAPELILELLKIPEEGVIVGEQRIENATNRIPLSAKAIRAQLSDTGTVWLLIEDDSFEKVVEDTVIPHLVPQYKTTRLNTVAVE